MKVDDKRPKCVDLFSGAGGFTLGIAAAGFNVVGHVEWSKECHNTYNANKERGGFANSELIGEDITKITDEEILTFKKRHKHISAIVGSPPCQSFSTCGKREIGDPRDNLFLHFVRFVKLIQPNGFILENVPGLINKKSPDGKMMIDIIKNAFNLVGYRVEEAMLNAANYGVPQTRRRVILIGTNTDKQITFPLPLNFGPGEGTRNPDKHYKMYQYKQCVLCGKYYGSYTYIKNRKPLCLFCDAHNKNSDKTFTQLEARQGWIVVPNNIPVPAKAQDMLMVRHIETRQDLRGSSYFLYCQGFQDRYNNITWINRTNIRYIADDNEECDNAESFVMNEMFVKPINSALRGF